MLFLYAHNLPGKGWCFSVWIKKIYMCVCVCVFSLSVVSDPAASWAVAHQAPLSMEFSRQEYWNGVPFLPPGHLPSPRIEPASLASPALAGANGKSKWFFSHLIFLLSICMSWRPLQKAVGWIPMATAFADSLSCMTQVYRLLLLIIKTFM